jgi:predicted O-methyltransferase YrrM
MYSRFRGKYSLLRLARKYISYYFRSSNGKGHGIHSPFVFDFVTGVLNDNREYPVYALVEGLRRDLRHNQTMLEIDDLGAGSGAEGGKRSVADIARNAAKPRKLGQLLFRIARHYNPGTMLELGTSLGLSAVYLAAGAAEGRNAKGLDRSGAATGGGQPKLVTIEGAADVATVAAANFAGLGLENIDLMRGSFDDLLPGVLARLRRIDLVFIDGNHRREPTLNYFNLLVPKMSSSAVMIFDDIHWSGEMEKAWEAIRKDQRVLLTVDLFFIGLVFLREEFRVKQDFVIRF